MAIHEKALIEAERLRQHDSLTLEGVDVSGHWNTMIRPRTLRNYHEDFEKTLQRYPGAENVHRCWQCGSCTNSCTMYAQNLQFNPRYWIYLSRLGLTDELIKDKDIIWQCVSCNKCTHICPRDVRPEGVMKALLHWMEDQGITPKSPSTIFDEEFTAQIYKRGRIEDTHVLLGFFHKTKQSLFQPWLLEFSKRMSKRLPVKHSLRMGLNAVLRPKTKSWGNTGEVLSRYVSQQKESHRD
ncbi:4Fe-4S dicluster domain-containing protein [Thiorhodospira sibirica]|uniref:4Fe-4S dicluster domain-containing protein n=1 Tax=Thiorhodospira sibirica TaxID=154347 RepID=UPI00022C22EB|nr:4Fe-4S dicluster domain-containing protein [Thiorhodospira sibirica]